MRSPLRWRHNGRDVVSNHQPHNCLFNHSGADHIKHQSSALLAFVRGIHRWPVNSPHKGPVTRKCFHLMTSSWIKRIFFFKMVTTLRKKWGEMWLESQNLLIIRRKTVAERTIWYWKPRVVCMPTLSSLASQRVVVRTTPGATSDDKVGITATFDFQGKRHEEFLPQKPQQPPVASMGWVHRGSLQLLL